MMNGANHPMGPLALADFIGLDIVFHMSSLLQEEYKESRFAPPRILRRMVLAGILGRKSGKGFYDYSSNPPTPNRSLFGR
jgi:3-hydroxybutyryl-CoA dehydrogenase